MPTVRTSSGKHFSAEPDQTLLDAALRAGVAWAYSCRTGRCGTCRAHVVSGSTANVHPESGLTDLERQSGWILTCARSALTDVALQVEDLGDLKVPSPRMVPCRVHLLERLSHDVVRVVLRLPPDSAFEFRAGQYVNVIGHGGVRRSYSIANAPAPRPMLELHIRRVDGGAMSQYWFGGAKVNDLLRLDGPLGTFVLRDVRDVDLLFLATGTGIAPVKAMLESLAAVPSGAPAPRSLTVAWGGRTREDLYWDPTGVLDPARYLPVLSRADSGWERSRGHVQDAVLGQARDWSRTVVYACGSDRMIHSARDRLVQAGLSATHFHSDAFVCSSPD